MKALQMLGRLVLVSMAVFLLVASPLPRSGRVKMSTKKLCEGAGGTYAAGTCNPGSSKNAEAICQAHGGIYLAGEDNCDIPYSQ